MDNLDQIVIDSEEVMMKKKNEYIAKKKGRFEKLYTTIGSFSTSCSKFSSHLLPCFGLTLVSALVFAFVPVLISHLCLEFSPLSLLCSGPTFLPALMPTFVPALMLALVPSLVSASVSCFESSAISLSRCVLVLAASANLSLPCHALIFCLGSYTLLSFYLMPTPVIFIVIVSAFPLLLFMLNLPL